MQHLKFEVSNPKKPLTLEELKSHQIPFKSFSQLYTKGKKIGKGGFGKVYEAECLETQQVFAAKFLMQPPSSQDIMECEFMRNSSCYFLQVCTDFFINEDHKVYPQLVMISELAEHDLDKLIEMQKGQPIEDELIRRIMAMTAIGLQYLHKKSISHRDLKPANILMYADQMIKICDFGLARMTQSAFASISSACTPMFAAPEVLGKVRGSKPLPFKADIYSLGATACYLMNQEVPDTLDLYTKSIPFKGDYSEELKDFVYFLLVRLPQDRPDIDLVLAHPCIATQVKNIQTELDILLGGKRSSIKMSKFISQKSLAEEITLLAQQ